eukprot:6186068-Pleurochrysis_carterae.AAC.2
MFDASYRILECSHDACMAKRKSAFSLFLLCISAHCVKLPCCDERSVGSLQGARQLVWPHQLRRAHHRRLGPTDGHDAAEGHHQRGHHG